MSLPDLCSSAVFYVMGLSAAIQFISLDVAFSAACRFVLIRPVVTLSAFRTMILTVVAWDTMDGSGDFRHGPATRAFLHVFVASAFMRARAGWFGIGTGHDIGSSGSSGLCSVGWDGSISGIGRRILIQTWQTYILGTSLQFTPC